MHFSVAALRNKLQSVRREVYAHHRHLIYFRLKKVVHRQREFIIRCWYLNVGPESQLAWFYSLLLLKACPYDNFFAILRPDNHET